MIGPDEKKGVFVILAGRVLEAGVIWRGWRGGIVYLTPWADLLFPLWPYDAGTGLPQSALSVWATALEQAHWPRSCKKTVLLSPKYATLKSGRCERSVYFSVDLEALWWHRKILYWYFCIDLELVNGKNLKILDIFRYDQKSGWPQQMQIKSLTLARCMMHHQLPVAVENTSNTYSRYVEGAVGLGELPP